MAAKIEEDAAPVVADIDRDSSTTRSSITQQLEDVKKASWRWPTRNRWFSHLEEVWKTADTSGADGQDDPRAGMTCPFEVTTMVKDDKSDLMPDVVVKLRSPYLISLLRTHMPAGLADALCRQKPEIDAKDLFFVWPTLRQLQKLPAGVDDNNNNNNTSTSTSSNGETKELEGNVVDSNYSLWTTRMHLRHLLRFLDGHFTDVFPRFQRMRSETLVSYKMLWAFLTPGTEVRLRCSLTATDHYGVVLARGKYYENRFREEENCFKLKVKVMDFNGGSYHQCTEKKLLDQFHGEVPFRSLSVCPLTFFSSAERQIMETRFLHRGRLFYEYAVKEPFRYLQYRGSMNFYKRDELSGNLETTRVNADGRVMVDLLSTARANPDWPLGNAQPSLELIRSRGGVDIGKSRPRPGTSMAEPESSTEPSKKDLKWAPGRVFGFSFSLKKWGCFDVEGLSDVSFNDEAYEELAMRNAQQKKMLRAIVSAKLATDQSSPAGSAVGDDIVAEKGQGCVVLCYGPPGTGKTLTAEALAESLHRPLWRISAFELGEEPGDVERNLRQALTTASRWRAVVLLDEADGYLERRTHDMDMKRNLLTGVFLRLLEYHDGVLFLTTNRVRSFDTALLSRVSFSISYAALDDDQRRGIWKTLLARAGAKAEATLEEAIEDLLDMSSAGGGGGGGRALNGRDIRNVVALARTWAAAEGADLGVGHVRDALEMLLECHGDDGCIGGLEDEEDYYDS